jgi:hypothetical protein
LFKTLIEKALAALNDLIIFDQDIKKDFIKTG